MIVEPPAGHQLEAVRLFVAHVADTESEYPLRARITASLGSLCMSPTPYDLGLAEVRSWALLAPGTISDKAERLAQCWEATACLLRPHEHPTKVFFPDEVEAAFTDAAAGAADLSWLHPGDNPYRLAHTRIADLGINLAEPAIVGDRLTLAGAIRWLLAVRPTPEAIQTAVGVLTVGVVIATDDTEL